MGLEVDTALGLGVLQVIDRGEMTIGERRVGQRPQMLDGLELVHWQLRFEVNASRHAPLYSHLRRVGIPSLTYEERDDFKRHSYHNPDDGPRRVAAGTSGRIAPFVRSPRIWM